MRPYSKRLGRQSMELSALVAPILAGTLQIIALKPWIRSFYSGDELVKQEEPIVVGLGTSPWTIAEEGQTSPLNIASPNRNPSTTFTLLL